MPQAGRLGRLWAAMRPKRACIKRLRLSEGNAPKAIPYLDKIKIRHCKADIAIAGILARHGGSLADARMPKTVACLQINRIDTVWTPAACRVSERAVRHCDMGRLALQNGPFYNTKSPSVQHAGRQRLAPKGPGRCKSPRQPLPQTATGHLSFRPNTEKCT